MTEVMASSAVVEAIKASVPIEMIALDGQSYLSNQTYLPPRERQVETLTAHTLSAIACFIQSALKSDPHFEAIAHIVSPTKVNLVSPLFGRAQQRHTYLSVDCSELTRNSFRFSEFHEPETFIIGLLSQFVDAGDRALVLKLVGNLRSEDVTTTSDDGVSQGVTVRKGVSSLQEAAVPAIVQLAPYRTFRSIPQPASNFLLRFKKGRDLPSAALFEADGSTWKHEAISFIRTYLEPQLSDLNTPIID